MPKCRSIEEMDFPEELPRLFSTPQRRLRMHGHIWTVGRLMAPLYQSLTRYHKMVGYSWIRSTARSNCRQQRAELSKLLTTEPKMAVAGRLPLLTATGGRDLAQRLVASMFPKIGMQTLELCGRVAVVSARPVDQAAVPSGGAETTVGTDPPIATPPEVVPRQHL